jgi:ribose/xylose/arabinose/galactoside ABC-type transport system permease subunit
LEKKKSFVKILGNRAFSLGVLTIIISIVASFLFQAFPTFTNFKSVMLNISTDSIATLGMMLLLISGIFDLSIGSVFGLAGAISANLMYYSQFNTITAILIALITCMGIGIINALLITKVGVNPLIVTLAMMGLVRGCVLFIAGTGIIDLPDGFLKIADNAILKLRIPVWYMVIIVIILSIIVSKTSFFRKYYYIGNNETTAFLSGINIVNMRIISFVISSGLAGVAGIILTSRLGTAISTLGYGLEFKSITACILGGASLAGGQGTMFGAFLGVLFMGVINNLMIIARISVYWQSIVSGCIFLIAVTVDAIINKSSVE